MSHLCDALSVEILTPFESNAGDNVSDKRDAAILLVDMLFRDPALHLQRAKEVLLRHALVSMIEWSMVPSQTRF